MTNRTEYLIKHIKGIIAIDKAKPQFYDKDRMIDLLKGILEELEDDKK